MSILKTVKSKLNSLQQYSTESLIRSILFVTATVQKHSFLFPCTLFKSFKAQLFHDTRYESCVQGMKRQKGFPSFLSL